VGLAIFLVMLGVAQGALLPVAAAVTGFFTSFTYTWVVVYVPEIFPTERRGTCIGWTTTLARISYVVGPVLAAILLEAFPTMEWFWVVAAAVMLIPIGIILVIDPYETKTQALEDIEQRR
jgi:MFS family permease